MYHIFASTTGATGGGMSSTLIMVLIMIAIFYFMLIRPENKRKKEAETMRNSLKKGDWLTTIGGIYGRVVAVNDRTIVIETSEDRVRMEFLKSAVGSVGTLEEQAAAQERPGRRGRAAAKEAPVEELPQNDVVDETVDNVEDNQE